MNTQTIRKEQSINDLKQFAELLKNNGFTVIVSKRHPFKWLYFEKDGKIGTMSRDGFTGFRFATVHKPCRQCGTGFSIGSDCFTPSIEMALESLCFAPAWAKAKDTAAIRKYKDIEEFINLNKWADYYIY